MRRPAGSTKFPWTASSTRSTHCEAVSVPRFWSPQVPCDLTQQARDPTIVSVSALAPSRPAWSPVERYRHSLWLLTVRDLRVRYSTSALGYVWSILDPLVMAGIYWFVFTQVFDRTVGEQPYIVFLFTALLPWMWFNGAVSDR